MTQTRFSGYDVIVLAVIAVFARLFYVSSPLFWDSAVYLGMGKFFWSFGMSGLWEHIRPPLFPVLIGFFWKLGFNSLIFYKTISLVLSAVLIALVYIAARKDYAVPVFSASLIAVSAIIALMSFQLYTEIPAVICILSAYLLYRHNDWLSGVLLAAAFMFKFPAGIVLIPFVFVLLLDKNFKSVFRLLLGFFAALIPYLIMNVIVFRNPVLPFLDASAVIDSVLGCNILNYKSFWQYGVWIVSESLFYLFALPGIMVAVRKKNWLLLLLALLPLAYFIPMHCRDYRYLILVLPFLAILAGLGFKEYSRHAKIALVLVVVFAIPGLMALQQPSYSSAEQNYYQFNISTTNELWSSNPMVSLYSDKPINMIYYPVFHENPDRFLNYLKENNSRVWGVFLDNCAGGILCDSPECSRSLDNTIGFVERNFKLEYNASDGICWFKVYS